MRSAPPKARHVLLPLADLVALSAFVLVGVARHDGGLPLAALARVGLPLLGAWYLAGAAIGAFRRPGVRTLLVTWAVAVPVAVVVRTAITGGPWGADVAEFLAVAYAFTLLFVSGARLAALGFSHRRARA